MTRDDYESLFSARDTICNYCEANECENCIVTHLMDDAYAEYSDLLEDVNREDMLLELLACTVPTDPIRFNSETGLGEPQHWMAMPYDRSLEIVYEEAENDNRFYSWRIHCNEEEFDNDLFHGTLGVIDQRISDDLSFDTVVTNIEWAVKVASVKPEI